MVNHRTVPDSLREWHPIIRGSKPRSSLSIDLLAGRTKFVVAPQGTTWGNLYKLAKNHKMIAHTRWDKLNDEYGYFIWFEDTIKED